MKKVSHRNAPGAISAMALTVSPVRPSVDGGFAAVVVVVGAGDIRHSFLVAQCQGAGTFVFERTYPNTKLRPVDCSAELQVSVAAGISPVLRSGFGWCRPLRRE